MESFLSDQELLDLFVMGSRESFALIYDRYHQSVYGNIYRLLRDASDAEDVLQEVFLTLWVKKQSIRPDKSLKSWLFTVSYHLSIDLIKRRRKVVQAHKAWDAEASSFFFDEGQNMQWPILEEAINSLSPQKKKVFQMCKMEGKSYDQAAKELGISKYTINEYLKDGMALVRQYIRKRTSMSN